MADPFVDAVITNGVPGEGLLKSVSKDDSEVLLKARKYLALTIVASDSTPAVVPAMIPALFARCPFNMEPIWGTSFGYEANLFATQYIGSLY